MASLVYGRGDDIPPSTRGGDLQYSLDVKSERYTQNRHVHHHNSDAAEGFAAGAVFYIPVYIYPVC